MSLISLAVNPSRSRLEAEPEFEFGKPDDSTEEKDDALEEECDEEGIPEVPNDGRVPRTRTASEIKQIIQTQLILVDHFMVGHYTSRKLEFPCRES
jgi:hypothetical protein